MKSRKKKSSVEQTRAKVAQDKKNTFPKVSKKKPALSKTTSKAIYGPDAAYGDKKKRRSEQPRTTKYAIAKEEGRQLRYRKVKYD
jgi:hypothetical protein